MVRISVDVMGGDFGPKVAIPGAAKALERHPDIRFVLFGNAAECEPLLAQHPKLKAASTFHHCDVAVAMDEKPSQALRRGRAVVIEDIASAPLFDSQRDALLAEWKKLAGQDARFDQLAANTERLIAAALTDEYLARPMTEAIARTIQGAELLQHSTAEVSNAFFTTRCGLMGSDWGSHFGTMGTGVGSEAAKRIVQRDNVFA